MLSALDWSKVPGIIETAIVFFILLGVIVVAHEWGHFLFARWNKMGVEEFAIGFGKKIWVWMVKNGTEFTVRLFPLGGFVRIKGMEPQDDGSEVDIPDGFYSKSPLRRLSVLFAGPLFSVLAGVIVLCGLYFVAGVYKPSDQPVLGIVLPGSPAAKAGLQPGDRLISMNHHRIDSFYQAIVYVRWRGGEKIHLDYERNGKIEHTIVVPEKEKIPSPLLGPNLEPLPKTMIQAKLGVTPDMVKKHIGFLESWSLSWRAPVQMTKGIIGLILKPERAKDEIGGIGMIALATSEATKQGIESVIALGAALSISIGIMNLLPIPPLDGGQMVVAFIEFLRGGRRLSIKMQSFIGFIGFAVLVALILGTLWLDFQRIFFHKFLPK